MKFDNKGTTDLLDDVLLDGATFEVYADDGDEVFDDTVDALVFGPAVATDGRLETGPLDAGWYWIVETIVPDGFTGSDPILVELNLDAEVTCIWDAAGLVDCVGNDGENEESSWTIVEVENTPEDPSEEPTGSTLGETGTPEITLPPTDTLTGANGAASESWRLVLLAMAGVIAAALLLTPARLLIRTDEDRT